MFPMPFSNIIRASIMCTLLATPATFLASHSDKDDAVHAQVKILNLYLPSIITALNLKSILDLPCRSFSEVSNAFPQNSVSYTGANSSLEIIEHNIQKFGTTTKRNFECCDPLTQPVPTADLVICRDYLSDLSQQEALIVINNFRRAGVKYLFVTTNSDGKFYEKQLCKHAKLPKPILSFKQKINKTKAYMSVWKLSDITC